MVRINLIDPSALADQHLVAEYNEILMLLGYVRRYPDAEGIPQRYTLGKGHIKFFKDKLSYIRDRHEQLKTEMRKRGFVPLQSIDLKEFPLSLHNNWKPDAKAIKAIKERIIAKLRMKPQYYRYHSKTQPIELLVHMVQEAKAS
jgi:deoxyribonuclease (pyrimidine dimer)